MGYYRCKSIFFTTFVIDLDELLDPTSSYTNMHVVLFSLAIFLRTILTDKVWHAWHFANTWYLNRWILGFIHYCFQPYFLLFLESVSTDIWIFYSLFYNEIFWYLCTFSNLPYPFIIYWNICISTEMWFICFVRHWHFSVFLSR